MLAPLVRRFPSNGSPHLQKNSARGHGKADSGIGAQLTGSPRLAFGDLRRICTSKLFPPRRQMPRGVVRTAASDIPQRVSLDRRGSDPSGMFSLA